MRKQRRLVTAAVVIGATLLVAGVAFADSGPALISGVDPYAACTDGGPGFNYPSTEIEPYVAVNPADNSNIVGVFQQDRWNNGAARGLAAAVTINGGQTWSTVTLPFSSCAPNGLNYSRASDPWISFGPDGTAYATSVSVDFASGRSTIGAAVSHDGGLTWGDVHELKVDTDRRVLNDKESVTADPVHPGVAYVMWDRANGQRDNQPTYFARTTDYGKTWSKPRRLTSDAPHQGNVGEIVVVDPRNDTLYAFYAALRFPRHARTQAAVDFMVSHNRGATWSKPKEITYNADPGARDPSTGAWLRTGVWLPSAAIDPKTGELYVVWADPRLSNGGYDQIVLSRSTNGGRTWSAPMLVSRDSGLPAVTPSVAVNSDGVVGVSYFDFRTEPTSDPSTLPTSYWLTTSSRGGKAFKKEQPIITTPFDFLSAPNADGYFLGDYQGLATAGPSFVSFFAQATGTETTGGDPSNRTDLYFHSLQP